MTDHQQSIVSAFILSVVAVALVLIAIRMAWGYRQRAQAAFFRLDRWERTMKDHLHWFGPADPMLLAVLENIQQFACTARPQETSKSEAFDLHTKLWRKRANEISRVFKNLAGREMEEMSGDELKSYMLGLAIDRGPQSNEFRSALSWLIGEAEGFKAKLREAEKVSEQSIAYITDQLHQIDSMRAEVEVARDNLNRFAIDLVELKGIMGDGQPR